MAESIAPCARSWSPPLPLPRFPSLHACGGADTTVARAPIFDEADVPNSAQVLTPLVHRRRMSRAQALDRAVEALSKGSENASSVSAKQRALITAFTLRHAAQR